MPFQVSATIENIATRSDKTIKITVGTQELAPDQASLLLNLHQKIGWFLFQENPFVEKDLAAEPAPEFKESKSPSKRLRDCLYVWWEKNTNKKKPFDDVWRDWCNKKCEEIKETLN